MREQLQQYVELLFAGAANYEDIKQEILQNTLDRYDDLIAEGKVPEAAYRLCITGIGDLGEILGMPQRTVSVQQSVAEEKKAQTDTPAKRYMRAAGVALYIMSPIPLFVLSDLGLSTLGLCGTIFIVAIATMLVMLGSKKEPDEENTQTIPDTPEKELRKSIRTTVRTAALVLFLILSFVTGAWYITWLIFPISGALQGLIWAIMDYKEADKHET